MSREESLKRYNNKPEVIARRKKWIEDNKEKYLSAKRRYYEQNKDKFFEAAKQYAKENPAWKAAHCAKRRSAKLKATPLWANFFFLEEAYDLAQRRTKATGIKWEVDHIIPLQNKNVCGLHTIENIQVIPATVNYSKNNKHFTEYKWSDFFNAQCPGY